MQAVNLLSRSAMELSEEAFEVYERLAAGEAMTPDLAEFGQALREQMFLLEDDFDELSYVRYRVTEERFDASQLGLVITPTLGCNFSCHYCFEEKQPGAMSRENQNRLLAFAAGQLPGRRHLSVQWFGGEPLEALPVVTELSRGLQRLAEAAGASYTATLITNGYQLTGAVAEELASLGVTTAQVSLDGDRELHDRTRHEASGAGSFDTILENIKKASRFLRVKLRAHVGPFSIPSAHKLVATLSARGMAPHVHELYFAPLFNYHATRSHEAGAFPYFPDGKRFFSARSFAAEQTALLAAAHAAGFRTPDPLEASYGICTAVRNNTFVIDADGNLMKCYKDVGQAEQAAGHVSTGMHKKQSLLQWMDIAVPRDEECRSCQFLPVCLGGCTKQWLEGAPKEVICTPLRFNWEQRFGLYFAGLDDTAGTEAKFVVCSA